MPRKPRIHVPGGFYHVTLRGNHRQDIFLCDAHREWFEAILAKAIEKCGARVHAYCWMTNHVHLLIQVSDVPVGRVMLRVASQYARRVQSHLQTTGHLFERRFHDKLIDADEYLVTLLRYIHANPVVAKMVTSLDQYPWSSHHAYAGGRCPPWLTTSFALSLMHPDPSQQHEQYLRLMADELVAPQAFPVDQLNPDDPRVLGDDGFLAGALGLAWKPKLGKSLQTVIDEACTQFEVTVDDLESRSTSRKLSRIRAWIAHECVSRRIASVAAVARRFGRDESTVREGMERHFGLSKR
jgi:REP element-mobilizing transposase RayT